MTTRMERRGIRGGPRAIKHALKSKLTPLRVALIAAGALVVVLAVAGYSIVRLQGDELLNAKRASADKSPLPHASIVATDGAETSATLDASGSILASAGIEVEVPGVVGRQVDEAEIVLKAVGFTVQTRVGDHVVSGATADSVVQQTPSAGTRVKSGSDVTLVYNPRVGAKVGPPVAQRVVCIDAGHQQKADLTLEPIGPGAKETKPTVAGGGTGVVTRVPEYQRTLEVSLKLRDRLAAAGVQVVMVRTTNDVNIANSERAKIGNRAGAALTVRVHFDSSSNRSMRGISTLYPSGNAWCAPIEPASKRAAGLVEDSVCAATGAKNRGIVGRADMSGFNWSTVPTIIVESGFLSNADDDRLAASSAYQDKIAEGIAAGVLAYLNQ
jgi:N-acetylmuramoyl-L-alanine amidase